METLNVSELATICVGLTSLARTFLRLSRPPLRCNWMEEVFLAVTLHSFIDVAYKDPIYTAGNSPIISIIQQFYMIFGKFYAFGQILHYYKLPNIEK